MHTLKDPDHLGERGNAILDCLLETFRQIALQEMPGNYHVLIMTARSMDTSVENIILKTVKFLPQTTECCVLTTRRCPRYEVFVREIRDSHNSAANSAQYVPDPMSDAKILGYNGIPRYKT